MAFLNLKLLILTLAVFYVDFLGAVSKEASCYVFGTNFTTPEITGIIYLSQEDMEPTLIKGYLSNLPAGIHGFHLHQYGDISDQVDASGTGSHWNPFNVSHSCENGHAGDLSNNIISPPSFRSMYFEISDPVVQLSGIYSVIGRSFVIHEKRDDCNRTDNGNAGKKIAQCVIGIMNNEAIYEGQSALEATCLMIPTLSDGDPLGVFHLLDNNITELIDFHFNFTIPSGIKLELSNDGNLVPQLNSSISIPFINESALSSMSFSINFTFSKLIGRALLLKDGTTEIARCVVGISDPNFNYTNPIVGSSTSGLLSGLEEPFSNTGLVVGIVMAILTIVGIVIYMIRMKMKKPNPNKHRPLSEERFDN